MNQIAAILEQLSAVKPMYDTQSVCLHTQPQQMSDWQRARLDYFQKHALPPYIEQLKFRRLGLQIFVATEAVLFNAWACGNHSLIAVVGLAACVGVWLWDRRTRDLMDTIHRWGREIADRFFSRSASRTSATGSVSISAFMSAC
jgi:hypothetical protein